MNERTRDLITEPLTLDYFQQRTKQGWTLVAIEWAKPSEGVTAPETATLEPEEIPYGYRISDDCLYLIENASEVEVLLLVLAKVVVEWQAPRISDELNLRGYRTRHGAPWTAAAVFRLMPQLIQMGPKLLKRPDWPQRRRLTVLAG